MLRIYINKILYLLLYLISLLPLKVLYLISDLLFIIIFYLINYRKKLVLHNIKNSFPHKNKKEQLIIYKDFYKHLCDYLVETIKLISISKKQLNKRFKYNNINILNNNKFLNKNIMLLSGHIFNWEWFVGIVDKLPTKKSVAVYNKINNKFWNKKILDIRSRFGTYIISMKSISKYIIQSNENMTYFFICDQRPNLLYKNKCNISFLNQKTNILNGFDKLANRKNMIILYCDIKKIKRGYYTITFHEIKPDNNNKFDENEISYKFFKNLENTININPSNWLWTHNRWKK